MPQHVNGYSAGLNKDTSESLYSNNSYTNALDFRIITDDGLSTGVLVNIKGNEEMITLPTVNSYWRLECRAFDADTWPVDPTTEIQYITITTDGPTFFAVVSPEDDSISLSVSIKETIEGFNSEPTDPQFEVGKDKNILSVTSSQYNILNIEYVYDIFGSPPGIVAPWVNVSELASQQSNLEIIGTTYIRETIVLFTTNVTDEVGGVGQIWTLNYDKETLAPDLKLVYTNDLKFTTRHLIEAVGRFEYDEIQRVYWTDNFNPPRTFNIVENDPFTTPLAFIDSVNNVDLKPSKIVSTYSLGEGAVGLRGGAYQTTYRLKDSLTGVTSNYARLSDKFRAGLEYPFVTTGSQNRAVPIGDETSSGMTIRIDIGNNTNYDIIEVVVVYEAGNSSAAAYKVDELYITGQEQIFDYDFKSPLGSGAELDPGIVGIEKASLTIFNTEFDKVKTLTIKDNRLLYGNIEEAGFFADYDAKAYRYLINSEDTYTQDDNAINPYNRISTAPGNEYAYQKNDVGPGGTGENISYSFINKEIVLDNKPNDRPQTSPDLIRSDDAALPNYRDQILSGDSLGYQRREVYRFGIVFYSKGGRPTDVKWIGDIRMPSHEQFLGFFKTPTQMKANVLGLNFDVTIPEDIRNEISGFSIVRAPRTFNDMTVLAPGLMTEIQTDEIYNNIGDYDASSDTPNIVPSPPAGTVFKDDYYVVSVAGSSFFGIPLEVGDIILSLVDDPAGSGDWLINPNELGNKFPSPRIQGATKNTADFDRQLFTFESPNLKFDNIEESSDYQNGLKSFLNRSVGDLKFLPVGYFSSSPRNTLTGAYNTDTSYAKFQFFTAPLDDAATLANIVDVAAGEHLPTHTAPDANTLTYDAVLGVKNLSFDSRSPGNASYVVKLSDGQLTPSELHYALGSSTGASEPVATIANCVKMYGYLFRENKNQYSGNTQEARQNTPYILTGHYQSVEPGSGDLQFNNQEVFGGDTYITYFNEARTRENQDGNPNKIGEAYFVPMETIVNTEFREADEEDFQDTSNTWAKDINVYEDVFNNNKGLGAARFALPEKYLLGNSYYEGRFLDFLNTL